MSEALCWIYHANEYIKADLLCLGFIPSSPFRLFAPQKPPGEEAPSPSQARWQAARGLSSVKQAMQTGQTGQTGPLWRRGESRLILLSIRICPIPNPERGCGLEAGRLGRPSLRSHGANPEQDARAVLDLARLQRLRSTRGFLACNSSKPPWKAPSDWRNCPFGSQGSVV